MSERDDWKALLPAFLEDLGTIVDMDSGTYDADDVRNVATVFQGWLKATGAEVEVHRIDPALGPVVVGRLLGSGRGRVLLIGHVDTVFQKGDAARRPFRVEGEKAFGPGIIDMKAGCLLALYAAKEIVRRELPFGSITLAFNPDEEIGSPSSRDLLGELAKDQDAVFVLEPGRSDGSVVVGRKGVADFVVRAKGRSSHAGVAPQDGRSAIMELCEQALALREGERSHPGLTFNVGVIRGGTRPNVVPEDAEMVVDVRATTAEAVREAEAIFHNLRPRTADVTLTVEGGFAMPPMETTEAVRRLYALAEGEARAMGIAITGTTTGGGSDANRIANQGKPVLDGLGPLGGGAHTPDEYLLVSSVAERGALLTRLLARIGREGF